MQKDISRIMRQVCESPIAPSQTSATRPGGLTAEPLDHRKPTQVQEDAQFRRHQESYGERTNSGGIVRIAFSPLDNLRTPAQTSATSSKNFSIINPTLFPASYHCSRSHFDLERPSPRKVNLIIDLVTKIAALLTGRSSSQTWNRLPKYPRSVCLQYLNSDASVHHGLSTTDPHDFAPPARGYVLPSPGVTISIVSPYQTPLVRGGSIRAQVANHDGRMNTSARDIRCIYKQRLIPASDKVTISTSVLNRSLLE